MIPRTVVLHFLLLAATSAMAQPRIVVNAGEEPKTKAWTQPASFAYTSVSDAPDSWALDAAVKIEAPISKSSHTMFVRALAQRDTRVKKEVENYSGEIGAAFDVGTDSGTGPDTAAWYLPTSVSLTWSDKTTFPNPKATCTSVPLAADCTEQAEESLRLSVSTLIFRSAWEDTFYIQNGGIDGPRWTHAVLPVLTMFYDELIDSKPNAAGTKPDGGISAAKIAVSVAFSPRFSDYRLVFSGVYEQLNALSRTQTRESSFASTSSVMKLSADYEFGQRSFENGAGWIPALGVTFTAGDEPMVGKLDQEQLVLGLKLTYRSE